MSVGEILSHRGGWWRAALVALALYLAVCGLVFLVQRRLIYLPSPTRWPLPADFQEWRTAQGEFIGYKRVHHQPDCLFFFHGNGGNARGWSHAVAEFPGDVFVLEYPGYGQRPGKPSESSLKAAALEAFRAEHGRYRLVIVCGQSLGAAVTESIFTRHGSEIDLLVLVAPFVNLAEMARAQFAWLPTRWLVRDKMELFDSWLKFPGRSVIVLAAHDEIIPRAQSLRYAAAKATNREIIEVEAGHNSIELDSAFWEKAMRSLQER